MSKKLIPVEAFVVAAGMFHLALCVGAMMVIVDEAVMHGIDRWLITAIFMVVIAVALDVWAMRVLLR